MGWASATEIVNEIIKASKKNIPDGEVRKIFYKEVIGAFEDRDWDTQDECLEKDIAFDAAMKELHPGWFSEEDD